MKYDPNDILTKTSMPDVRINYKNLSNEKKKLGFGSPDGISKDEIPPGDEHLYVLKSEIVPPVCPKCPEQKCSGGAKKECPPCPRPERCPEPAFTCKKVPNYSAASVDNVLPSPMFMSGGGSGGSGGSGGGSGGSGGGSGGSAGFGGGAGSNGPMPMLNSFAKFS